MWENNFQNVIKLNDLAAKYNELSTKHQTKENDDKMKVLDGMKR